MCQSSENSLDQALILEGEALRLFNINAHTTNVKREFSGPATLAALSPRQKSLIGFA